ncbi:MAG: NERD domain-containing protein [Actinobacteria bacterium]|nr:NERD domain-containing protein [Actinomycetota bacterium]
MEIGLSILKQTWYLWVILFVFVAVLPSIIKIFKPRIKGFIGEKAAALILSTLDKKKYRTINDLIIRADGESTQIDHVVISNYGIFVIETKNYKGWITGYESRNYWKQVIYKENNNFFNPIKQNEFHIELLRSALKLFPEVPYYPIVSFANEADIKVKTDKDIVYEEFLLRTITSYKTEVISDDLKNEIFNYLKTIKLMNKSYAKVHVQNIKRKKNKIKSEIKIIYVQNVGVCSRRGQESMVVF